MLTPQNDEPTPRIFTLRAILLGLLGVVIINAVTPFNDYVLNNSFFVGNNLPLGLMGMALLFVVCVNGPLSRWAPKRAFSSAELTVAFSLALVGCALPSSGLMRYLPPLLVEITQRPAAAPDVRTLMQSMDLPQWMFPTLQGTSVDERANDPVITGYNARWIDDGGYPWTAWARPALTWGVFIFALYGALMGLVTIVRRQWHENERLPFPLAQMQMALIEQPKPGRFFNGILSKRSLWIGFFLIFAMRAWNGLGEYFPGNFPSIPMGYDLRGLFSERPLSDISTYVKSNKIWWAAVGVTYFLSTPVAFSLWVFMILEQIYVILLGTTTGDPKHYGTWDEHLGACAAFLLTILWVGRKHWALVLKQAFRGAREGEPRGEYLPYPLAFWGMLSCAAILCGWLWMAGCTVIGAIVVVALLLTLFLLITRVIAETGLVYGQLLVPIYRPWQLLMLYGFGKPVPTQTFFMSGVLQDLFYDFREPMPVYASHAMKLADTTMPIDKSRSIGRKFIGLLALALLVSYVVSFASTLGVEYAHASTIDTKGETPINWHGLEEAPKRYLFDPTIEYNKGRIPSPHSAVGHIAAGFGITAFLASMRMLFVWWPLHPVGFLLLPTTPMDELWFSIMIGWCLKVLIVRIGGATLYQNAKPFFLGIVLGETAVACTWLVVSLGLSVFNVPFHAIKLMPG